MSAPPALIELYTATTPNGRKVSIALEELGLPYSVRALKLKEQEQKQPWFLEISPNGRIPAIIDRGAGDLAIFESGAILLYLAEKTGRLIPADAKGRWQVIQWLMWQMGGLGPMQGQANVFFRYLAEKIPAAISRYQNETRRLYGVLDRQLEVREHIVGDLSIADIACYPWVAQHDWSGIALDEYPQLKRWYERLSGRPSFQRGMAVPDIQRTTEDRLATAKSMIVT